MKKLKFFCSTLAAVAGLMLFSHVGAATVQAAEPVTYAVNYDEDHNKWVYQPSSDGTLDTSLPFYDVYYLAGLHLKDGDSVVVYNYSDASSGMAELNLGGVHLANLTYASPNWAVVRAASADELYVLGGTSGTFNGTVTNAYVYNTSVFNFNGDVTNLTLAGLASVSPTSSIGCSGSVYHLYAPDTQIGRTYYDIYEIESGKLSIENGNLMTSDAYFIRSQYYSLPTPTNTPDQLTSPEQPAATATPAPATPTAPAAPAADDSAYDDVPKTGQNSLSWYLLCAGAFLAAGSLAVKRSCR